MSRLWAVRNFPEDECFSVNQALSLDVGRRSETLEGLLVVSCVFCLHLPWVAPSVMTVLLLIHFCSVNDRWSGPNKEFCKIKFSKLKNLLVVKMP